MDSESGRHRRGIHFESFRPSERGARLGPVVPALTAIVRRRGRIAAVGLAVFLAFFVIALAAPTRYVAETSLLILPSGQYGYRATAGSGSPDGTIMDRDVFMTAEADIVGSDEVASTLVARMGPLILYPDLAPGASSGWLSGTLSALGLSRGVGPSTDEIERIARARFEDALTISSERSANILVVTFRHEDPHVGAKALNELVDVYIARRRTLFADDQTVILSGQVDDLKQRLDTATQKLTSFKAENDISDFDLQRELLVRRQNEVGRDRDLADQAVLEAKGRVDVLETQLRNMPQDTVTYQGRSTQVRRDRNAGQIELEHARAVQDLEAAKARLATIAGQADQVKLEISWMVSRENEYRKLRTEVELLGASYTSASALLSTQAIQESVASARAPNVRIIDRAAPPTESDRTRQVLMAASLLLGLFVSALYALFVGIARQDVNCPEAAETALGVPVLSSVPVLRRVPKPIRPAAPRAVSIEAA